VDSTLVAAAISAISSVYGPKAAEFSIEQVKSWLTNGSQSVEASPDQNFADIDELTESILKAGTPVLDAEITRKNLARWFEVPFEEFGLTPPEQLEPEVLVRHLILENLFQDWLTDWGYDVTVGEDLEGKEGIDFTPDVYGSLTSMHGRFEVCVNFVCDQPPSQYRVRALLETLEAYATDTSDFKWGDIYILATPFQFGRGTAASITLQSREEKYTVVALEGDDLHGLQTSRDRKARLTYLMEHVAKSSLLGPER